MVVDKRLYDVLLVDENADASTIKKAFRNLALKHHPDKNGDPEKFKEINAAYKVLSDEDSRRVYDATGSVGNDSSGGSDMDFFSQLFGNMGMGMRFPGMHGHSGMPGAKRKGGRTTDLAHELQVPLDHLYSGKKKTVHIKRTVVCKECKGHGGKNEQVCAPCKGSGSVFLQTQNGPFMMHVQQACHKCNGHGKSFSKEDECKQCATKGHVQTTETIEVNIPAGAPNGHTITFSGKADEREGFETGDLHFVLVQQQHESFKRKGNDIITSVPIDLSTALVGGTVHFKHIDGTPLKAKLQKGKVIRVGDTMSMPGKGMPIMGRDKEYGELHVNFDIQFPSDEWSRRVSEKQVRDLLRG
jgi:DnaJ family protein A protein 2